MPVIVGSEVASSLRGNAATTEAGVRVVGGWNVGDDAAEGRQVSDSRGGAWRCGLVGVGR